MIGSRKIVPNVLLDPVDDPICEALGSSYVCAYVSQQDSFKDYCVFIVETIPPESEGIKEASLTKMLMRDRCRRSFSIKSSTKERI